MTGMRLLVVDDEPHFGEFVREIAEDLGYEVRVTTRGNDFTLLNEAFNPTLVLLDIVMPEIDGTRSRIGRSGYPLEGSAMPPTPEM